MSKKCNSHIVHSRYTSSESDDDICIIGEQSRRVCRSLSPLTVSDSSSQDEPRFKRKHSELGNDTNLSRNEQRDNKKKKRPEFIIDNIGNPEQLEKECVMDRNGANSSAFSHGLHSCEVCNCSFHTHGEYLMHMQDRRHQKAIQKMGRRRKHGAEKKKSSGVTLNPGYPPVPAGVIRRKIKDDSVIQNHIEKNFPPCPGLEKVTEIRGLRENFYFCGTCSSICDYERILNHLRKPKHQLSTLKAIAPEMYISLAEHPKRLRKRLLFQMLKYIQDKEGPGRITVEKEYPDDDEMHKGNSSSTLENPSASSDKHRGVPLYESTRDTQILSDQSKIDYYCVRCEVNMVDTAMWESHYKRSSRFKGLRKLYAGDSKKAVITERRPKSEAFLVDRMFDQDEPAVGLDFILEFQHLEDKKETYHCTCCSDCLSCIDVTQHVTSLTHRINYLESINHYSIGYIKTLHPRDNKTFYIVEETCRKVQKEFGTGFPEVYIIKKN